MKITQNFSMEEMCRTSVPSLQEENTLQADEFRINMHRVCCELEKLRANIFRPIYITSGFRCPAVNSTVGGSKNSQHMTGSAADFTVKDFQDRSAFIFSYIARK